MAAAGLHPSQRKCFRAQQGNREGEVPVRSGCVQVGDTMILHDSNIIIYSGKKDSLFKFFESKILPKFLFWEIPINQFVF